MTVRRPVLDLDAERDAFCGVAFRVRASEAFVTKLVAVPVRVVNVRVRVVIGRGRRPVLCEAVVDDASATFTPDPTSAVELPPEPLLPQPATSMQPATDRTQTPKRDRRAITAPSTFMTSPCP